MAAKGVNIAGLVLAGGKSHRMGTDKAMLKPWGEAGPTLLARAFALLAAFLPSVFVSCSSRVYRPYPCIMDKRQGFGPAGGIAAALEKCHMQGFDGILAIPCDMPLLMPCHLRRLLAFHKSASADFLVSMYENEVNGWQEMLVAVYRPNALEYFAKGFGRGENCLRRIIPAEKWHPLSYNGDRDYSFMNCNRPEDMPLAKSLFPKIS